MDWRRVSKAFLVRSVEALLFCNILILTNIIVISSIQHDVEVVLSLASLFTFLEGGIGLTMAGLFVVSSGPTITKFSEKTLHGLPYSTSRAREAEGRAQVFIFVSLFLILFGYLLAL
jgi:hypothetical protein